MSASPPVVPGDPPAPESADGIGPGIGTGVHSAVGPARVRTLAGISLGAGILAVVIGVATPVWSGLATVIAGILGVVAVTTGILAWVQSRRAHLPVSPIGVIGLVLGAVATVVVLAGVLMLAFFFVFAERLGDPEPPSVQASAQARALAAEEQELAASGRMAAELLEVVRRPDGTYPAVLAVTTDGRRLITADGLLVADLPGGTEVAYETYVDARRYQLLLFAELGSFASVDSEHGYVEQDAEGGD